MQRVQLILHFVCLWTGTPIRPKDLGLGSNERAWAKPSAWVLTLTTQPTHALHHNLNSTLQTSRVIVEYATPAGGLPWGEEGLQQENRMEATEDEDRTTKDKAETSCLGERAPETFVRSIRCNIGLCLLAAAVLMHGCRLCCGLLGAAISHRHNSSSINSGVGLPANERGVDELDL
jgi:hypothetical protein